MRPCTIPILAAVAFSLVLPAIADADPRSGPGASTDPPTGPVFWPRAASDLLDYTFFPKGKNERFWAIGYGAILSSAFGSSAIDDPRPRRNLSSSSKKDVSNKDGDPMAAAKAPDLAAPDLAAPDLAAPHLAVQSLAVHSLAAEADRCGTDRAEGSADQLADQLMERIERAISPIASQQRDILDQLRSALVRAADRINTACPTTAPATAMERLNAVQDRIWAMRDGLLTVRLPFERFYASLTGDQDWHLARATDGDTRETAAKTETSDGRSQMCSEQASGIADWPMRAIGRALQPTEPQRASLEALHMRLSGMAQLIIGACPTYPLLGPMGRLAAASDRLDVMLFAVMAMSPVLPDFYDSLSDRQKGGLRRVIRQFQRSALSRNES
jgi:hypothetical protein